MNKLQLLTLLFPFGLVTGFAQNTKTNREGFILKLPVNKEQYYEQEIAATPYFVKEGTLQIYPGEKLYLEVEKTKKGIKSIGVVKENINPEKTIALEFSQEVIDGENRPMILKISNPFKNDLEYKAAMYVAGHSQWVPTNVLPVRGKLISYEMWPDVIISLVLSDFKLL